MLINYKKDHIRHPYWQDQLSAYSLILIPYIAKLVGNNKECEGCKVEPVFT